MMGLLILLMAFFGYHTYRWFKAKPFQQVECALWQLPQDAPKVSFLVPAWNAAKDIPEFVNSYAALGYPNKELILCAGGMDGSLEIAKAFESKDTKVIEQRPGQGKQRGLQESFPFSRGAIIYLTDIDCRPTDTVIHNLLTPLIQGKAQVVTGASRPLDEQLNIPFVRVQWAVEQVSQLHQLSETTGILGRNAALSREAIKATHAFAEPAPSGTDYTLAKEVLKVGYRILFVPGSPMPSEYPAQIDIYIKKQARWIRNVFILGKKYGAANEVRAVLTTLMLPIALLGGLALWGVGIKVAGILSLLFILHAVFNRIHYLRYTGLKPQLIGSVMHFIASQMAALKAGWQILRRQVTW